MQGKIVQKIGLECNKKKKKTIKRRVIRDIDKRDIFWITIKIKYDANGKEKKKKLNKFMEYTWVAG